MKLLYGLIAAASLSLIGCVGTVAPNPVSTNVPIVDSSTPPQYDQANSGFLGYHDDVGWIWRLTNKAGTECQDAEDGKIRPVKGVVFGVITPNKLDQYNTLIGEYPVRFKNSYAVALTPNAGITPWQDDFHNDLYAIDRQHLTYFIYLEQFKKDRFAPDGLTTKLFHKL